MAQSNTPTPLSREELEKAILKQSLVQAEVIRWEKKTNQPIEQSHQAICEIGIDDLMSIIDSYFKAFADEVDSKKVTANIPDHEKEEMVKAEVILLPDFKALLEKWGIK